MPSVLLTTPQAAAAIGISLGSFYTYIHGRPLAPTPVGRMKATGKGVGPALWNRDALLSWAAEHRLGTKNRGLKAKGLQRAAWGSQRAKRAAT